MSEYASHKSRKPRGGVPTPFKTPKHTPYRNHNKENDCVNSDSSSSSEPPQPQLSLVAEFDDIIRMVKQSRNDEVEDCFLRFAKQAEEMHVKWFEAVQECKRLQSVLGVKDAEISNISSKLNQARALVDHERKVSRKVEEERDLLEEKLGHLRDLLAKDATLTTADNRERLNFLNAMSNVLDRELPTSAPPHLSAIIEGNTTGSLLSDFSYSKSEDDLDVSNMQSNKTWKKHRPSTGGPQPHEPAQKKRKSSSKTVEISNTDTVRATTTLTVPKSGPITATSVIESVPAADLKPSSKPDQSLLTVTAAPLPQLFSTWQQASPLRPAHTQYHGRAHVLQHKTLVIPDTCTVCERRMGFGRGAWKCRECRALVHGGECRDRLPTPCVPLGAHHGSPRNGHDASAANANGHNNLGLIGDYTPTSAPMVPALVVHCLKEIEARGFNEVGIYRIPGSERDVKHLKERFMRGRGAPCLNAVDIHVLCGAVKDFLRSLSESLVTKRLWHSFVNVVDSTEGKSEAEICSGLKGLIAMLPQPNRDTLAYMLLHLKRVAVEKECKMPCSNLAKIFGPTIIGYSSNQTEPTNLYNETRQQVMLMEWLLNLSEDYWCSVLNVAEIRSNIQQTPSTDSLLRPTTTRMFFTPNITRTRRPQKFFPTPPN